MKTRSSMTDFVDQAVNTDKNHLIILFIKHKLENIDHLPLKEISICEVGKQLRELNSNKAAIFSNMSNQILKQSRKSCSDTLQKLSNDTLRHSNFPDIVI